MKRLAIVVALLLGGCGSPSELGQAPGRIVIFELKDGGQVTCSEAVRKNGYWRCPALAVPVAAVEDVREEGV